MLKSPLVSNMKATTELYLKEKIDFYFLKHKSIDVFHEMLSYHLGWATSDCSSPQGGKRIRPIILLLTVASCNGNWQQAIPAAAAIEFVHNFSLVHDDIQDRSDIRHGRMTIWKKWGIAQGINVGDAMFSLAYLSIQDLDRDYAPKIVNEASRILGSTCLALTHGQFLDIFQEKITIPALDDYWTMISGKTAALIRASSDIGALLGEANPEQRTLYRSFGEYLGLAFQIRDDYLGIWGETECTGKPSESDLINGKMTLPIIYGLSQKKEFFHKYSKEPITADAIPCLVRSLENDGAKAYTQKKEKEIMDLCKKALVKIKPFGDAGELLVSLMDQVMQRKA